MQSLDAFPLILAAGGAFITPILAGYLRLPAPVLEILYGVFLGHFGWFKEGPLISMLAELGFLVLLFVAGAEVELRLQREKAALMTVSAILAVLLPFLLLPAGVFDTFFAIASSAISVGMVHIFMRESTEVKYYPLVIFWASAGEIITLFILSTIPFVLQGKGVVYVLTKLAQVLLLIAVVYFTFLILKTITWWFPRKVGQILSGDPSELGVRIAFASIFIMAGITILLGMDPVLGAFLTGLIFSLVFKTKGILLGKMNALAQGFLIPIFFIDVGAKFNIYDIFTKHSSLNIVVIIALLCAVSFFSKFISLLTLKTEGASIRETIIATSFASAPLTLIVITADVGLTRGLVSEYDASILIGYSLVSALLFPAMGNFLKKRRKA